MVPVLRAAHRLGSWFFVHAPAFGDSEPINVGKILDTNAIGIRYAVSAGFSSLLWDGPFVDDKHDVLPIKHGVVVFFIAMMSYVNHPQRVSVPKSGVTCCSQSSSAVFEKRGSEIY